MVQGVKFDQDDKQWDRYGRFYSRAGNWQLSFTAFESGEIILESCNSTPDNRTFHREHNLQVIGTRDSGLASEMALCIPGAEEDVSFASMSHHGSQTILIDWDFGIAFSTGYGARKNSEKFKEYLGRIPEWIMTNTRCHAYWAGPSSPPISTGTIRVEDKYRAPRQWNDLLTACQAFVQLQDLREGHSILMEKPLEEGDLLFGEPINSELRDKYNSMIQAQRYTFSYHHTHDMVVRKPFTVMDICTQKDKRIPTFHDLGYYSKVFLGLWGKNNLSPGYITKDVPYLEARKVSKDE